MSLNNDNIELFVTIQLFIPDSVAIPLKQWLVKQTFRPKLIVGNEGTERDNWKGITERKDWLLTANLIAHGLADIHRCRVIHGDIWPSNIFITLNEPIEAIFIDFGESFIATPTGDL